MLKNKKILLTIFMTLLLLLIPNMVKAAVLGTEKGQTSTGVEVNWIYNLEGETIKNLSCTNVSALTGELEIPAIIDEHSVTSIGGYMYYEGNGYYGFKNATGLTKVTIQGNITSLGEDAFRGCTGLRDIIIPNTMTSIGKSAFRGCTGLTDVVIPDSVTTIGECAFGGCTGLKTVQLSDNMSLLSNELFSGCTSLTEIELPENLTTIGTGAYAIYSPFNGCVALKFIKIPENVTSIAKDVFKDCTNLIIYGEEDSYTQTYAENNNIPFANIENWDSRNENAGKDIAAPEIEAMYVEYSSVSQYYNNNTKDYRLPKGAELRITVEFTENIQGTEVPTLTIKFGQGQNINLIGTISANKIIYNYTIKDGDNGLLVPVKIDGGNVTDAAGNNAKLDATSIKEIEVTLGGGYIYADSKNQAPTPENSSDGENPGEKSETATLSSISITKAPTKTTYAVGEKFDKTGMVVTAKYTDGTTKTVTGYTYSTQEALKISDTKITITYKEGNITKTAEQKIKVEQAKDPTTTKQPTLPNTGKVLLIGVIAVAIIAVIIAYVRYKKLYI